MSVSVDHIVVVVPSLAEGAAAFEAAGFTVSPGGRHQEVPTENMLVPLADGSYLELLAARDPDLRSQLAARSKRDDWPRHLHEATALGRRFLPLLAAGDGVADWVLHGVALTRFAREARTRGHVMTGPTPMRRQRPDGVELAWRLLLPASFEHPFLIEDASPRTLRVPAEPAALRHANGATGLAAIDAGVESVPRAAMALADLFGWAPRVDAAGVTRFDVGPTHVRLRESDRPGAFAISIRGAGPLGPTLAAWGVSGEGATPAAP